MPTHAPCTSLLTRLAEIEARYDGPIPSRELDALRYGSPLAADIAETRAEIAFFRDMAARARRSGKVWRAQCETTRASRARTDCNIYLAGWRSRRRRLRALERVLLVDAGPRHTLSAIDGRVAPLTGERP